MSRVRVAIVEDHPIYRDGLANAISAAEDLDLVGAAGSLAEAHDVLSRDPDVVLLDLGLPDGTGLDLLTTLRARRSPVQVVVLTMNDDPELVLTATRAGARGYLLKGAGRDDVVDSVRRAATGAAVFDRRAADVLISAVTRADVDPATTRGLTRRERDVLRLLAEGLGNAEIAARLGVATKTVRNQVSAVLMKLGVVDRRAAADWARANGIPMGSGRLNP